MDDCVFCSIVDGNIPGHTVYETDRVLAFLDANPLREGHTLVIPKAHHERLGDLPDDLAGALFEVAHRLPRAMEDSLDADGATVAVNDGPAAGQEVPHVHAHVVPRTDGDDDGPIHALFEGRPDVSDDRLAEIASAIEP
ncbi:MAG: HIT family protein [Halococcoides sp.]